MTYLMRYLVCLLLSLAAGSGAYALGAVIWSALDPQGAGGRLLFTIPLALAGMAVPGIAAAFCFVFRCDLIPEPKAKRSPIHRPTRIAAEAASSRPARKSRPRPSPAAAPAPAPTPAAALDEDLELALAT